jgi:hypothetical protein
VAVTLWPRATRPYSVSETENSISISLRSSSVVMTVVSLDPGACVHLAQAHDAVEGRAHGAVGEPARGPVELGLGDRLAAAGLVERGLRHRVLRAKGHGAFQRQRDLVQRRLGLVEVGALDLVVEPQEHVAGGHLLARLEGDLLHPAAGQRHQLDRLARQAGAHRLHARGQILGLRRCGFHRHGGRGPLLAGAGPLPVGIQLVVGRIAAAGSQQHHSGRNDLSQISQFRLLAGPLSPCGDRAAPASRRSFHPYPSPDIAQFRPKLDTLPSPVDGRRSRSAG